MTSDTSKKRFNLINFKNGIIFDISVILICCLSFGFSCIESSVNLDSHHWGFMYVQALDLKRGLIPYKEIFIAYGYLTSWIQSIAITILGQKLTSLGIVTGLFYSLSILLSYKIFLKFLPKYLAFFCTFCIFLLHGYITYPWANYYSYTFELAAIIFFIKNTNYRQNMLIAGLFVGVSLLCRNSGILATLPPFVIVLLYEFITRKDDRKIILTKTAFFIFGFLIPIVIFLIFLIFNNILYDFILMNKIQTLTAGLNRFKDKSILLDFFKKLIFARTFFVRDLRSVFFTINFFWSLFTLAYLFRKSFFKHQKLNPSENIIITLCLVTLFGYLNSIHIYEVFRLVNGSSIGIGVMGYTLMNLSQHLKKEIKILILLPLIAVCFILADSLIFKQTSSVYNPWRADVFNGQGVTTNEIQLFQGKLLSKSYYDFYHEIFQKLSKFDSSYFIINFTQDTLAPLINDLPRVQLSPAAIYIPILVKEYPEESQRVQEIINQKKAVILSSSDLHIPGYKVIFNKTWPGGIFRRQKLHISVPEEGGNKFSHSGYNF